MMTPKRPQQLTGKSGEALAVHISRHRVSHAVWPGAATANRIEYGFTTLALVNSLSETQRHAHVHVGSPPTARGRACGVSPNGNGKPVWGLRDVESPHRKAGPVQLVPYQGVGHIGTVPWYTGTGVLVIHRYLTGVLGSHTSPQQHCSQVIRPYLEQRSQYEGVHHTRCVFGILLSGLPRLSSA